MSQTYACPVCTYIQSIANPACEMCQTLNPHIFVESATASIERAIGTNFRRNDGLARCRQCQYINVGYDIQICENCQSPFNYIGNIFKHFRRYRDDNEDKSQLIVIDEDDGDVERKPVESVEKGMDDDELVAYFNKYIRILNDQQRNSKTFTEDQLKQFLGELFNSLEYQNNEPEGELISSSCQICCDDEKSMVTMKVCGHQMICRDDFHLYISTRIRDKDILPWILCPAATCSVPCHVQNIIEDAHITSEELLTFLTTYMLKKLSRNINFISCVQCERGGFLQLGTPRKQEVICPTCNEKQMIEKGANPNLDSSFQEMVQSGQLRECPTCRHLTLKEKGICNIIECAKCGIWWNWRTKEQGRSGKHLKQRARINGTLWESGELKYQQELQRNQPEEFKALLERNGIAYDPNYIRGGWDDE